MDEYLENVPEDLRELVAPYVPVLKEMDAGQITGWFLVIIDEWQAGYAYMVKKRGAYKQVSEIPKLNKYAKENGLDFEAVQKKVLKQLAVIAMDLLKEKNEKGNNTSNFNTYCSHCNDSFGNLYDF